jgi:iron-sulfur cluster repair protein YtfE (RIC family)
MEGSMPSETGSTDTSATQAVQSTWSVNETLQLYPAATAVFNKFGIDACCGGAASISEAAIRDGANPDELLSTLNSVIGAGSNNTGRAA